MNAQHMKLTDDTQLATLATPFIVKAGVAAQVLDERLPHICALFKDRCETLVDLAAWVRRFQDRPAYRAALAKGGPYNLGPKT